MPKNTTWRIRFRLHAGLFRDHAIAISSDIETTTDILLGMSSVNVASAGDSSCESSARGLVMVALGSTLRVLALTKLCASPYSFPRLANSFLPETLRISCAAYNSMTHGDSPTIAPFGTWKSPLESETVYQKSSSISDLLVDVKTGKVFHIEVCPEVDARRSQAESAIHSPVHPRQAAPSSWTHCCRPTAQKR